MQQSDDHSGNGNGWGQTKKGVDYLMNTRNWWGPLTFILIISLLGVGMIGFQTYYDAPPEAAFAAPSGDIVMDKQQILNQHS